MSHPLEVWCGIECAVKQVDYHFYNQIVPHKEQSWFGDQAYFRKRNSSRVGYTTLPRVKLNSAQLISIKAALSRPPTVVLKGDSRL
jgi:hypothetical protein